MAEAILILFWYAFFFRFFTDPYAFSTGEHLENYFPFWRWMGKQIKKGKGWFEDTIYYYFPGSIPFTCAWYPPQVISSYIGTFLKLDHAFVFYTFTLFSHYLFGSYFAYKLFSLWCPYAGIALIAALTMTYGQKFINMNAAMTYTSNWIPFILYFLAVDENFMAGIGTAFMFTAGYTTMLQYTLFLFLFYARYDVLPYLIPLGMVIYPLFNTFMYYWKSSIRTQTTYEDRALGSVPPWHFISLLWPLKLDLNGVSYHELSYGVGRVALVLALFCTRWPWWCLLAYSMYLMMGKYVKAPILLRIPVKASYLLTIAIAYMVSLFPHTIPQHTTYLLLFLHTADLILNHAPLLTARTELPKKPSKAFMNPLAAYLHRFLGEGKVSGLPFPMRSGYLYGFRTIGYTGGSSLQTQADYLGYDSNGAAEKDYFLFRDDDGTDFGIKYALTRQPLKDNWIPTEIPHLYRNKDVI